MGQALYRKYRSKHLDEIVGQSHITAMLSRAIKNDTIAHAYLLTGPRGVGKTSIARILAHEINGLPYTDESTHLDIIEIDAASNNGVDDIRDLRERVMVAPTSARKKIYIIDEVHMLSKPAFNALLKTLEEPPEHVVFILATTDVEKVPATILSRVQRFNFRAISPRDAAAHLRTIADAEEITITDDALALIARLGRGSFRDSISLLDQLRNLTDDEITQPLIESVLGFAGTDLIDQLLAAHEQNDLQRVTELLDDALAGGMAPSVLAEQLADTVRRDIIARPQLLSLLERLAEVPKSTWPDVKLLLALAPDQSAIAAPARVMPKPAPVAKKPVPTEKPTPKKSPKPATAPKPSHSETAADGGQTPASLTASNAVFPWNDFLSALKEPAGGAHSLLQNSDYTFDGTLLTIFAGNKFAKTQLDKAMPHLSAACSAVGVADGEIVVKGTKSPPKSSQAASIIAMMGGGEEVRL